jgi:long-chain acyl-CoA synthetase
LNRFVSRLAHTVPIDPQKGVFSSLAFAGAVLKRGKNLIWFPEGGRSHSGRLQPFKPGIGIILEKFPVKACPVFIAGTERAMPWGAGFPKPVKVRVTFGKPVSPEQLQETGSGENPRERIVQGLYSRVVEMARAEGRVPEGEES